MTAFTKENLDYFGGYITVRFNGKDEFIARLRYGQVTSKGPMMTLLRKHFTVEEYLARHEAGEAPLTIMESKGFVLSHIKKWLKAAGFPQTQEGYKSWRAAKQAA